MLTQKSETLFEKSKRLVPGGVHSPVRAFRGVGGVPRFIRTAQGAEIEDVDGNRYIDFCMSWGPLIFGHQDPSVMEAVQAALRQGWSYGTAEPYSLELAEWITQSIPALHSSVEKIRFVNSGTEAVMAALRVARAATGRNKIVKFDGCYHGHVDSMLVRAGSGLAEMASPDSAGVSTSVASETVVVPLNDLDHFKKVFEIHGKEIAAVIIEAIPANNGLLLQKEGFLKAVGQIAKTAGSLLILDEVITGFRVALGGMIEKARVQPDLVTYGKVIGGGFPVGAYGGRAACMDWVAPVGPVYQAGTLSANPVTMVAGLSMLKKLKQDDPYPRLEKKTEELALALEAVGREAGFPIRVQRESSIFWMILGEISTQDGYVRTPREAPGIHREKYSQVFHQLIQKGIYLAPSAFEVSFLSTAHRDEHCEKLIAAVREAVS